MPTSYAEISKKSVLEWAEATRQDLVAKREAHCQAYLARINDERQTRRWHRLWLKARPFLDDAAYLAHASLADCIRFPDDRWFADEVRLLLIARAARLSEGETVWLSVEDMCLVKKVYPNP